MLRDLSTRYVLGELHQACSRCDWRDVLRNAVERTDCPHCGAPVDARKDAIEFGGLRIQFDGVRFKLQDSMGRRLDIDEADYPDAILFMQRHARRVYSSGIEDPT